MRRDTSAAGTIRRGQGLVLVVAILAAVTTMGCKTQPPAKSASETTTESGASDTSQTGEGQDQPNQKEETERTAEPDSEPLAIERTFTGVLTMSGALPGDSPEAFQRVLRTQEEYEAFIGSIPKEEISMTNPAPKSDDPLLDKPAIDFSSRMALVAARPNTIQQTPELDSVQRTADVVTVRVRHPSTEGIIESLPMGVGAYALAIVPRHDGEVVFEIVP